MESIVSFTQGELPYEPFVREVLVRLQNDLRISSLVARAGETERVVEAPSSAGRNVVVPSSLTFVAPSVLPERSMRTAFCKFHIIDTHRRRIRIPWLSIVRDHGRLMPRDGFIRGERIDPKYIVVLRWSSVDNPRFSWYVRFDESPYTLSKVPLVHVNKLFAHLISSSAHRRSSLATHYIDYLLIDEKRPVASNADKHHTQICDLFAGIQNRILRAIEEARPKGNSERIKRKRDDNEYHKENGDLNTCVVCLNDKSSAHSRCRHGQCGTHVCSDCHLESRGFCPLCDRSHINSDFLCSGCNTVSCLQESGFPCVTCNAASLCKDCFIGFGECGACGLCGTCYEN